LLELWSQAEQYRTHIPPDHHASDTATHDRVGVFWALLLLSAQSKVELAQVEFYRDLKVHLISGESVSDLADWSARVLND